MWWRRGWFLNTLNYQIEKNLRESIYINESYKENRWNFIERQVHTLSKSPGKYLFLLFISWLLSMVLIYTWLPDIRLYALSWSQPWSHLSRWQGSILAAQLAIVGFIFPLVIGFVGLLFQNKSANRALWSIYSRYSGFMFTGFSGLLLIGFIIFGQYIHPWLSISSDTIFSLGISIWLLFNILMSAWFLYATFQFTAIDRRNNLVLRYCINETLIDDIKSRLSVLIPHNAIYYGLILDYKEDESREVITFYFTQDNDNKYVIKFRKKGISIILTIDY